jgi:hypothetical protein
MPYPNYAGSHQRYWTRELTLQRLFYASRIIRGRLPCCDREYNRLKKDRLDWPPAARVLGYFGSMARAWLAAGVDKKRVTLGNNDWSPEEDEYLQDRAGAATLDEIGVYLRRTAAACKRRLYSMGITARDNQGYLSASQLAREYNCSCHRIRLLLADGLILGTYDPVRHRWQVDPLDITPQAEALLRAPKRTHKDSPTDLGDYYQRYGLRRTLRNGKMVVEQK